MEVIRKFGAVVVIILLTASITFSLLDMLGPEPSPQELAMLAVD
ncbi:MAG: hypothetical protein PVF65_03495 [Sphingomonadales bacterium]|jgi:hypothetical protein